MSKIYSVFIFLVLLTTPVQGQQDAIIKITNIIIEFSISVQTVFKNVHDLRQKERLDSIDYVQVANSYNHSYKYYTHKLGIITLRLDSLTKARAALLSSGDTVRAWSTQKKIWRFKSYRRNYTNKMINLKKRTYPRMIKLLKDRYKTVSNQGQLIQEIINAALDYREEFKAIHSLSKYYESTLVTLEQDVENRTKQHKEMQAKYQYSDEQTYRTKVLPLVKNLRESRSKLQDFRRENQEFNQLNKIFEKLSNHISYYQHQRVFFPKKFKYITDRIHELEKDLAALKDRNPPNNN